MLFGHNERKLLLCTYVAGDIDTHVIEVQAIRSKEIIRLCSLNPSFYHVPPGQVVITYLNPVSRELLNLYPETIADSHFHQLETHIAVAEGSCQ